ncbi:MAG: flagellin [Planctomycetota bacterium]
MSRINTNVQSLLAQRVLGQNNLDLNQSLERLSTGLRINRGKDDPAGLIASENLKAEITSLNSAIGNAQRADQVVNIAEGGLQETSNLLSELQGLLTASSSDAGLSREEKEANQLQVDSILQTIDRISSSTSFQGIKLLNGNFDYQTTNVATGVTDFQVNGAKFGGTTLDVDVVVTQSAQQAGVFLSFGGTAIDLTAGSTFSLEVVGSLGSREISFASGTTLTDVAAAINTFSDITGIDAAVSGTGIRLDSTLFGSQEFVSVRNTSESNVTLAGAGLYQLNAGDSDVADTAQNTTFANLINTVRDEGQDVGGFVNGIAATGQGRVLNVNSDFLDVSITLSSNTADTLNVKELNAGAAFTITGGGADFQLSPQVDIGGQVSIGIQDIATRKLGNSTLGFLDELGNGKRFNVVDDGNDLNSAQKVVSEAINTIAGTRGRLGAFQKNVVGATIRSLGVALENTSAANSIIRDADFAAETANLTRNQILSQAAQNSLALANQQPQSALQLLG